jgi:hypothetical protein
LVVSSFRPSGPGVVMKLKIENSAARVPEPRSLDRAGIEVWRDLEGRVCAWAEQTGGDRWMHLPGVGSYRIRPEENEVVAIPHLSVSADLVVTGYWRSVLPMAIQLGGCEVLHASSIVTGSGVVGFCGVSMTGKSTTAHALNQRGYELFGDDALAFDVARGSAEALPLPFELQLREPHDDGATAPRSDYAPSGERQPLAAVCTLARAKETFEAARVRRMSPAESFPELLTHAYAFSLDDVERNRDMVVHYLDLVNAVPVFEILFRPGRKHLPAVLDQIERELDLEVRKAE